MATKPNRLETARVLAGLSLAQAARLLGCSPRGLECDERVEQDRLWMTPTEWRRRADLYGVSVAWLQGATPVISASTRELLRTVESTSDRAKLELVLGAIGTPEDA